MEKFFDDFRITLSKEMGEQLALEFVEGLIKASGNSKEKSQVFFYNLGKTWGPLIYGWANWIKSQSNGLTTGLILRDTKVLEPFFEKAEGIYVNRVLMGVEDEISGDSSERNHLFHDYMLQHNCGHGFSFVDTGCYGTIVLELYKAGICCNPLFLYSHNPNIPAYVNELDVPKYFGEILNDSLECAFPHAYQRPESLRRYKGKIVPVLKRNDEASVLFAEAAMKGLVDGAVNCPLQALEKLLLLSEAAAAGEFTGVLGRPTPAWSQREKFLANWPKELKWT